MYDTYIITICDMLYSSYSQIEKPVYQADFNDVTF